MTGACGCVHCQGAIREVRAERDEAVMRAIAAEDALKRCEALRDLVEDSNRRMNLMRNTVAALTSSLAEAIR